MLSTLVRQGELAEARTLIEDSELAVGDYVLQEVVGQGGMGVVYRARELKTDTQVALKILRSHAADGAALQRFHREIDAASKLTHSDVVVAYGHGATAGLEYLIMQFVAGQTLAGIVEASGPRPIEEAVSYVVAAAECLDYAHREGVIHRDVKPSNLMLAPDGSVKLLDIGIARVIHVDESAESPSLTVNGDIVGSPDFIAPEQAIDASKADARCDIYSLGATLFFLLTARPMFCPRTAMAKVVSHVSDPAPLLSNIVPDVNEGLEAVFQKMVAKKPADRYQNMLEVVASLTEVAGANERTSFDYATSMKQRASEHTSKASKHSTTLPSKTLVWSAVLGFAMACVVGGSIAWHLVDSVRSAASPVGTGPLQEAPDVPPVTVDEFKAFVLELGGTVEGADGALILNYPNACTDSKLKTILDAGKHLNIQTVDVSESGEVTDSSLKVVSQLVSVKYVYFQKTAVTARGVEMLSQSTNVEELQLHGISTIDDRALEHLPMGIAHLMLDSTSVTNDGLRHMRRLTRLQGLYLNDNGQINDNGIRNVSGTQISRLELARTSITDESLPILAQMTHLRALDIRGCTRVSEEAVEKLRSTRMSMFVEF